jgi:hypothetical protein
VLSRWRSKVKSFLSRLPIREGSGFQDHLLVRGRSLTMGDESLNPWGNFSLSNDEDLDVEVNAVEVKNTVSRGKSCVVGKLIVDHIVCKETIKKEMKRWWKLSEEAKFKVLGDNLFLIEFEDTKDKA